METRLYKTMITETYIAKSGRTLSINDYILGIINGVKLGVCDLPNGSKRYANKILDGGRILMRTECTEEQYNLFRLVIDSRYPGLCEFDVA